jgi:hypothetical protein
VSGVSSHSVSSSFSLFPSSFRSFWRRDFGDDFSVFLRVFVGKQEKWLKGYLDLISAYSRVFLLECFCPPLYT